jgi:micrococcal nuclease
MRLSAPAVALLVGCQGLDVIPVLEGGHCAEARDELVACTLDGDTFQVGVCGGESVRLLGINAPEIAHNSTEVDECWGQEAAAALALWITGETVRLQFDTVCTDAYDRTLAYAYLEQGDPADPTDDLLVNEELVRLGYVRVYEDFDDIRLADLLYTAQWAAKDAGLGLWSACE